MVREVFSQKVTFEEALLKRRKSCHYQEKDLSRQVDEQGPVLWAGAQELVIGLALAGGPHGSGKGGGGEGGEEQEANLRRGRLWGRGVRVLISKRVEMGT